MTPKLSALALALALWAAPAWAADAVTDAMQAAYVPYRAALFKTNAKAQAESEQTVADARAQFRALAERYADKAPAPYDRDPEFAATLKKVDQVLAQADAQIKARNLAQGHETLEQVRDLLGSPLDLVQFDTAVNMGPGRAVRFLQQAVGCGVDGDFGPATERAVMACESRSARVSVRSTSGTKREAMDMTAESKPFLRAAPAPRMMRAMVIRMASS